VFVGRLEPSKGIADLLQALPTVLAARPEAKLVLVGEGSARALCERAAASSGGRILVMGGRPLAEVASWMAAADLITLPSHAEGSPNVVLEALASGRRVVATQVGGVPDLIDAPALGELTPPRDPLRLAAALLRGLSASGPGSPDGAAIAAAAAAKIVSWEDSARVLHEVLQAALSDPVAG
jgi:glycosyltransferase involved in cell wall biosynthesis